MVTRARAPTMRWRAPACARDMKRRAVNTAMLVLPLSVGAQAEKEGTLAEPNAEKPVKTALFSSSGFDLEYSIKTEETEPRAISTAGQGFVKLAGAAA